MEKTGVAGSPMQPGGRFCRQKRCSIAAGTAVVWKLTFRRPKGVLRLAVLGLLILLSGLPALGDTAGLAYWVRVIRYTVTGDCSKIPGNADTPANEQAWLGAIATELTKASNLYYEASNISGTWTYTPIPLNPVSSGTGPDGGISESDIDTEVAKVTWIVHTEEKYGTFTDVWKNTRGCAFSIASYDDAMAHYFESPCTTLATDNLELVSGINYYGGFASVLVTAGSWPWNIQFICEGIKGRFVAPSGGSVKSSPATDSMPSCAVNAYYLGEYGPTGVGAKIFGFDKLGVTGPAIPPDPGYPVLPEDFRYAEACDEQYIPVEKCYADVVPPPNLPCDEADSCSTCGGSPVYKVREGDLSVTISDKPIWMRSPNGPVTAVRMYFDQQHVQDLGDFGRGWRWEYEMRIRDNGSGMKIVESSTGRGGWQFMANGDGTYSGPPSVGATLVAGSGGYVFTKSTGDAYVFNGAGQLLSVTDRFGHALTVSYSGGRIQSISDANGNAITFARDAGGRITTATESGGGRSATFSYDANHQTGFLTGAVDMAGIRCTYEYDWSDLPADPAINNSGRVKKIVTNAVENNGVITGNTTTFEYGLSGTQQQLTVTDPENHQTVYRWDHGNTEVFTKIEPSGGVTSEVHSMIAGQSVLLTKIDALENEWTYEYNPSGFLTKETDPLGNQTTYTRNSRGSVLTETRPGGATTTYTYAANGEDILTQADPLGNTTTYTYDANRNLLTATNALNQTTSYTYDVQGRRLTETSPAGLVTTNTYDSAGRLLSTTTSLGATTTYTYNTRGLVASVTSPDGLTIQKTYDDLDRVTQETYLDANGAPASSMSYSYGCCGVTQTVSRTGAITANLYDANKRLIATTDHFGNTTQFEYDGNGNRTKVRDALGNETVTAYDLLNRPSANAYPDGTTETFVYDTLGRQIRHTDRSGRTEIREYDARGNVTASKIEVPGDPDPIVYTLETATYDLTNRRFTTTNGDGLTVTYTYDGLGRVLAETCPDNTSLTRQYGILGATSQTDRLGHTTSYTYDTAGHVLTVTDPLNHTTTITYRPSGQRATVTNAPGQVTSFANDQEGRLVQTTYPGGTTETRIYTNTGILSSQTDRTGIVTSFTYDAMGRRLTIAVAGQAVDTVIYDALSRVATQTDARGIAVTMVYDSMGRVTRRTMPDGTHEDFTHGPSGVLTHADRAGRATTYTYDALGRRASETNPNNETIRYEYDLSGRMTKLIDANNNQTQWTYDTEGRLTRKTYADGSHHDYTYDANGKLLTRADAMNRTTSYSYDANGNLLGIDYPNDTDVAYTYDALGRRLTMTDASGTTTWTYDPATGKPATENGPFDNDALAFTWDAAGRRTATQLDGSTVASYAYDTLGRLATVSTPASTPNPPPSTFTYTYAGASTQVTNLAMPGGLSTAKTYDTLGRLTSVENSTPVSQNPLSSFAYTYDNSDRRTRVDLADTGRWQYSYDSAGQVTGGTRYGPKLSDNTEAVLAQYGYQYDPMGNPTQRSEDAAVSAYTFNNLNELVSGSWSGTLSTFGWTKPASLAGVSVTAGEQTETATVFKKGEWTAKGLQVPVGDAALTVTRTASDNSTVTAQTSVTRPADGVTFTHDLNGNMLTDGRWTYTWDDENRLVAAETASGAPASPRARIECVYDAQSRRRTQREYTWVTDHWSLVTEHVYTWDGWLLVRELRSSGGVTRSLTYLHGLDLAGRMACAGEDAMVTVGGIGGILAFSTPSSSSSMVCFFYDGNGNVVDLADSITGTNAAHYEYGPFGNTLVATGPLAEVNRVRFSTKEQDAAGMCYWGYRYYASGTGRWFSRDPIQEKGGPNLYVFCHNTPTLDVDILGLKLCKKCPTLAGLAAIDSKAAFMLAYMDANKTAKPKCQRPTITCHLLGHDGETNFGAPSQITIKGCWCNPDEMIPTLRHELVHAFDYCRGATPGTYCSAMGSAARENAFRSEMRAYANQGSGLDQARVCGLAAASMRGICTAAEMSDTELTTLRTKCMTNSYYTSTTTLPPLSP